ncbi:MAG: MFS transporter [Gammaproteobacteria bacterium]|nr:MFS transporter [Gammaproteobacteria bacterium]
MRPIHYYLLGTGSWFLAFGIQGVMFAWLVTMVLRESPEMVGIAQMTLLLPGTLLILIGGTYADRFGGRRILVGGQILAACGPLMLAYFIWSDQLSYSGMLAYAVLMGCATAFVTPARDGLLNEIAEGRVQRTVMLASMTQFGGQMVGITLAALTDGLGAEWVLGVQSVLLALGVLAFLAVPPPQAAEASTHAPRLIHLLVEGAKTVFSSASMRVIVVQNVAMAMFFMGAYIVTLPLLVREVFSGSAQDLALVNGANSLGLVLTIVVLLRFGDVARPGRALILSQGAGALVLAGAGLASSFSVAVFVLFIWGMCGGIAMTMSRTIMQEQAPEAQRGRVMSFYAFSFMGAGPLGAVLNGYLVEQMGPQNTLLVTGGAMAVVVLVVRLSSRMWTLAQHQRAAA